MTTNSKSLRFDTRLLETFVAVARTGRISQAAHELHLSQPAVTAHIKRLENELGTPLLLRSTQGVALTTEGRRLLDHAKKIADLIETTLRDVESGKDLAGTLKIAASTTIAAHLLPKVLAAFAIRHDKINIQLAVGNTETILSLIRDGSVRLGLVEGLAKAPSVHLEPFIEDEIICVAAPSYRQSFHRAADLANVAVIWREAGSGTRTVVERALAKVGVRKQNLSYRYVFADTDAIKGAVMANLGVGFISKCAVQHDLASGRLRQVVFSDLDIRRWFHWALPSGGRGTLADTFFKFANEQA